MPGGDRLTVGLRTGLAGMFINSLIFVLELYSGTVSGSTTVKADAFHNSADAVSAIVTVAAFLVAGKPADTRHPFGFGRIEYVSSLFIGLFISGIGLFFGRAAFQKLVHPVPVQTGMLPLILMAVSVALKLLYGMLNHIYAGKTGSPTLAAAAKDAAGDVLILAVSAVSIPVAGLTGVPVDGPLGLAVSGFILFSGCTVVGTSVSAIIGEAPDRTITDSIRSAVLSAGCITGIHGLVVHDYGPGKLFASVHAEVPSYIPLIRAHEAAAVAERRAEKQGIELVVHIDPTAVPGKRRYGQHHGSFPAGYGRQLSCMR